MSVPAPVERRLVHVVTVPATLSLLRGQLGFCARAGYDVHVVASLEGEKVPLDASESITLHSVKMTRSVEPKRDAFAVAQVTKLLRALNPAIVQAGTPKGGLVGTLAAALARVPVRIYHVRGLAHQSARKSRALPARLAAQLSCAAATHVLCVSQSVRARVVEDGLCSRGKTHVLLHGSSNGVDAEGRFNPALHAGARERLREDLGIGLQQPVIGFVGRLVRDKGIVDLTEAWRELRTRFPELVLLLVGPFEHEDPLPESVRRELENDPRVKITETGWGESAPFYAAMDVVCFPSHREGFPNVPLEAAAMGLPVVAERAVGSVDAVVHGETGFLVGLRRADELRDALAHLLDEPELRTRFGAAGRARAREKFGPRALWQAQIEWYSELTRATRRGKDASVESFL